MKACSYCGLVADTVDHVPPISARATIREQGIRVAFLEVPCCRECNSAIGNRALWTVTERKQWVKQWIRHRYRKYLDIPDWDEAEIAQLGYRLQNYVREGLVRRNVIRGRLSW